MPLKTFLFILSLAHIYIILFPLSCCPLLLYNFFFSSVSLPLYCLFSPLRLQLDLIGVTYFSMSWVFYLDKVNVPVATLLRSMTYPLLITMNCLWLLKEAQNLMSPILTCGGMPMGTVLCRLALLLCVQVPQLCHVQETAPQLPPRSSSSSSCSLLCSVL